jgi:hypothetical protein
VANLTGETHGDLCIYCNKINVDGTWRRPMEIDLKFMPLDIKNTICQNCSFERFPKFYMSNSSSNDRRTKRIASKIFSFLKKRPH